MSLSAGQVFAGYTVQRLIGSGGMGEVYLAKHPRLPRLDAIKILPPALTADGEYRDRFNREADLASSLWHPHIVGVHDRGEYEGQLWISMDFVDGTDAARLLRERYPSGLPVGETLEILDAVADALDYAHQRGLLHRDVKPANILLTTPDAGRRRILLADFGIARQAGEISGLTVTNMTIGTVSYAAPEQLMGEAIDGRADQYALAATAFHLLTGAPLFTDSNPAVVISKHLGAHPPSLAQRRPELAPFDHILSVALAKDPAARYGSCLELATHLRDSSIAAGGPTAEATPSWDATLPAPAPRDVDAATPEPSPTDPTRLAPTPRSEPYGLEPVSAAQDSARVSLSPKRRRMRPATIVPAVLAVVLVAALAFAGVEAARPTDKAAPAVPASPTAPESPQPPEWQPYVDAGKQMAVNLTTISYQSVDNDVQRVLDGSTGVFHDDFNQRTAAFKQTVRNAQSVSTGTVAAAGLESLDGSQARVLVAVTVTTRNANEPNQDPRSWRMRLVVDRVGETYKTSNVEFVP